jgi:hypothetical protein
MREIWGPAWFATALCAMVLMAMLLGGWEPAAPAFFCFLPVIFFQMSRTIQALSRRIEELERARQGGHAA